MKTGDAVNVEEGNDGSNTRTGPFFRLKFCVLH